MEIRQYFIVMGGSHLVVITTPFGGTEFGYLSWTASCICQYATIGINASDLYCRIWKVRSGKDHSYKCGKIAGYKCSLFVNSANDKGEAVKKKVILVC